MSLRPLLIFATAVVLLALPPAAGAQAHEQTSGPYVLRAMVTSTAAIAGESAEAHDLNRQRDRAILNVIVFRSDDPVQRPLPAEVSAHVTSLSGVRQEIDLREIEANDRLSYTGTFEFLPREVLDFEISAKPRTEAEPIELQFRERVWGPT